MDSVIKNYKWFNFPKLNKIYNNCFNASSTSTMWTVKDYSDGYKGAYHSTTFPKLNSIGHKCFNYLPFREILTSTFYGLTTMGYECFTDNRILTSATFSNLTTFIHPSEDDSLEKISSGAGYEYKDKDSG
jgi:hypothetical protein